MIEPIPNGLEAALRQALSPGEQVFVKLRGTYKEALLCTSTRVIILKAGWMTSQLFGTDMFQCPYQNGKRTSNAPVLLRAVVMKSLHERRTDCCSGSASTA